MSETYPVSDRGSLNRSKYRSQQDRELIHSILDEGWIGHLAWADSEGQPFLLPIAYARDEERLLFHGSTGAGGLRALQAGAKCAFNVTLTDALILARSAFESSIRFRSVSVLGTCATLEGDEKWAALDTITNRLFPGRIDSLRPMKEKEVAQTLVLALPLDEVTGKVSDGWPKDPEEDLDWPVWAGVLPIERRFAAPLPAPDLKPEHSLGPGYLNHWRP